jgi:diguanylate cyclase (GGDEF)-like protein
MPAMSETTDAAEPSPLEELPAGDLSLLMASGTSREAAAGTVLFRQGDPGDALFLVEEGHVRLVFDEGKEGKVLGPGRFFGEIALLARGTRTAAAVADSPCRLRVIDTAAVARLREEHPALLCTVLAHACAYLAQSERDLIGDLKRRHRELAQTLDFLRRTRIELDAKELLAQTDELTGLYNRRCLFSQFTALVEQGRRAQTGLALVLMDLDGFKPINDTWGHAAGDAVLRRAGAVLRESVRARDLPCRIGGDELAVVLVGVDADQARGRARELHAALTRTTVRLPETVLTLRASVGGDAFREGDDVEALLARADQSLYLAKSGGKNRVCWAGQLLP